MALAAVAGSLATIALAQMTPPAAPTPATGPATTGPASRPVDDYERLLGSENDAAERPLVASGRPTIDRTSGNAAVAPAAPQVPMRREGTLIFDRVGRLVKSPDGNGWEFVQLADAGAMQDPPLKVLPNAKLAVMEDEQQAAGRPLRFSISGTLTEYRGRNYVLMEKATVVRDPS